MALTLRTRFCGVETQSKDWVSFFQAATVMGVFTDSEDGDSIHTPPLSAIPHFTEARHQR